MLDVQIYGHDKLIHGLLSSVAKLHGSHMVHAMNRVVVLMQATARRSSPVDTGRLRSSIDITSEWHGSTLDGTVGSNVEYAAYMEYGTRPHWPPIEALEGWARRHKISPYVIALAIAMNGTRERKYMYEAIQKHKLQAVNILAHAVMEAFR